MAVHTHSAITVYKKVSTIHVIRWLLIVSQIEELSRYCRYCWFFLSLLNMNLWFEVWKTKKNIKGETKATRRERQISHFDGRLISLASLIILFQTKRSWRSMKRLGSGSRFHGHIRSYVRVSHNNFNYFPITTYGQSTRKRRQAQKAKLRSWQPNCLLAIITLTCVK